MLKTIRLFSIASCLSLFSLVGCAVDGTQGDGSSSSSEDLSKKKFHYEPAVYGVAWNAGCGPIHPQGAPCAHARIVLTYLKQYADLQTTTSVNLNADTKTITITLDTWSYSQIHSMIKTQPEPLDVDPPAGMVPGQKYKVEVQDRSGKCLFTGEVTYYLAA